MKKILVCSTGSVAALKLPLLLISLLQSDKYQVKVIVTEHAKHFFNSKDIPNGVEVYSDSDEWDAWSVRGDPVLHIELAKWADALLIAPLDANTLAKIANGICDNLLTCTVRAWEVGVKPFIFCPAMNTKMYQHPLTAEQIAKLKFWGYKEISVIEKTLICGDTGAGAMAEVATIVQFVNKEML